MAVGLLFSHSAIAAQNAIVTNDVAFVHELPDSESEHIDKFYKGNSIRISSSPRDGWFKVRTRSGNFGWVWNGDVAPEHYGKDTDAHLEEQSNVRGVRAYSEAPSFYLRAGALVLPLYASALSKRLGLGEGYVYFSPGGFFELGTGLNKDIRLGVRTLFYSHQSTVKYFSVRYDIDLNGVSTMLGGSAIIIEGESYSIGAGLYAGIAINNSLAVTAPNYGTPNSFKMQGRAPAAYLDVNITKQISRRFSIVGELGFYYSYIPKGDVPNRFNADDPFREDATKMVALRVNHIGPMVSVGLQLDL